MFRRNILTLFLLGAVFQLGKSGIFEDYCLTLPFDGTKVRFYYYPTMTEPVELTYDNLNSMSCDLKFTFVVHGWQECVNCAPLLTVANQTLQTGESNVIMVDWPCYSFKVYQDAACYVQNVGATIADMINNVHSVCQDAYIHLVGFSLGGQAVGSAGYNSQTKYGITVQRITGLDPAGPLFSPELVDAKYRLDQSDATFVDVLHTTMDLGTAGAIGHFDTFVNCLNTKCIAVNVDGNLDCGHVAAPYIYAKTIPVKNSTFYNSTYCSTTTCLCISSVKALTGYYANPNTVGSYSLNIEAWDMPSVNSTCGDCNRNCQ